MNKLFKHLNRSAAPALAGGLALSVSHTVYSLELPDVPLLLTSNIEHNVMLVLDDSGSMVDDFYYGNYDATKNYSNCSSTMVLPNTYTTYSGGRRGGTRTYYHEVEARTDASGNALIFHNGITYAWGNTPGTDLVTGKPKACFDKEDKYFVKYSADFNNYSNPGSQIDDNRDFFDHGEAGKGNFWNYYFSNDSQTGADNWGEEDQKFGVGERIEIVQDAAKLLVRGLDDIRIGLGGFDHESGGRVMVHIDSVDEFVDGSSDKTHADVMIEEINNIVAYWATPLGETLYDMGRYFIEGTQDQNLVLHPEPADEFTKSTGTSKVAKGTSVFNTNPKYEGATGGKAPTEPVIEAWCQKNYVVMMTDGQPSRDSEVSSDVSSYASSHNQTSTNGSDDVLDDVALALYDMDLRPDLRKPDGTAEGEAVRNNITTYLIAGFGVSPSTVITNAVDNGVGVGVDLDETGNNATTGKLYQADDGDQLVKSFQEIFEEIISKSGSQTAVAFNSGSIEAGTALYQATYHREDFRWTGDLHSYPYNESTKEFATKAKWSAAEKLNDRVLNLGDDGHEDRLIFTLSADGDGIEFTEANLNGFSAEAKGDLEGDGDSSHAKTVINYIRGKHYDGFRDRASYNSDGSIESLGLLGDIVNSSPIEVGEPELNYPDYGSKSADGKLITQFGSATQKYSQFAKKKEYRQSVVYVGANDGMLHAFDGDPDNGGKELFGYIPGLLYNEDSTEEGLYYLTDERYEHRFFVDGGITASDVFIDPAGADSPSWRTIIAGGLRAGGRGIYALDVTDPTTFSKDESNIENLVLWEFGPEQDSDVGYIYGKVQMSMMNNGKWAAVFGNGYNSDDGQAKLFIVFIEQGADGNWTTGDWMKLDAGSLSVTSLLGENGMSTPVLADFNSDRIADRIYVGDLQGNLWVYDVSSDDESEWGSAYGANPLFNTGSQPITTQPSVALNPDTASAGNGYNSLVYFGTGKILEEDDYDNTDATGFYAVWDRGDANLSSSDLQTRTLVDANVTMDNGQTLPTRKVTGEDITWYSDANTDGKHGWGMAMPEAGERITVNPNVSRGSVLFTTSLPTSSLCGNGGSGWIISVAWDGMASNLPTEDINGDGQVDEDDLGYVGTEIGGMPAGTATIADPTSTNSCAEGYTPVKVAVSNTTGEITYQTRCALHNKTLGRMSWQDLLRR
ncbi:pilus assembly protein [Halioxenophilus aromaticivorans]|uniref:PilC/PilY family type IV pilus protein n=1 Tax=Halioxenophilus aromaticivorans TaxID=1306992 RepID=A0AAV3TXZ6_9ALTE